MSDDSISGVGFCCEASTVYTDANAACDITPAAETTCAITLEDVSVACSPVYERVTCDA